MNYEKYNIDYFHEIIICSSVTSGLLPYGRLV